VTYKKEVASVTPQAFARKLVGLAGGSHTIWLVWSTTYVDVGTSCGLLQNDLERMHNVTAHPWVEENATRFYEPSALTSFAVSQP
jgi:hypothetical protein